MRNIILTNIAMEPIKKISWEKAAIMIATGTAENLISSDVVKTVHSPSITIDIHKVIYVPKYIRLENNWNDIPITTIAPKRAILERDNKICAYCLSYGDTVDHIVPKSRGGDSSYGNLITCCRSCNSKKANMTPEEANMKLLYQPKAYNHSKKKYEEMQKYLLETIQW